jgi:hypothetical protein
VGWVGVGWGGTESTWRFGHDSVYCSSPGRYVMSVEHPYSEKSCPISLVHRKYHMT